MVSFLEVTRGDVGRGKMAPRVNVSGFTARTYANAKRKRGVRPRSFYGASAPRSIYDAHKLGQGVVRQRADDVRLRERARSDVALAGLRDNAASRNMKIRERLQPAQDRLFDMMPFSQMALQNKFPEYFPESRRNLTGAVTLDARRIFAPVPQGGNFNIEPRDPNYELSKLTSNNEVVMSTRPTDVADPTAVSGSSEAQQQRNVRERAMDVGLKPVIDATEGLTPQLQQMFGSLTGRGVQEDPVEMEETKQEEEDELYDQHPGPDLQQTAPPQTQMAQQEAPHVEPESSGDGAGIGSIQPGRQSIPRLDPSRAPMRKPSSVETPGTGRFSSGMPDIEEEEEEKEEVRPEPEQPIVPDEISGANGKKLIGMLREGRSNSLYYEILNTSVGMYVDARVGDRKAQAKSTDRQLVTNLLRFYQQGQDPPNQLSGTDVRSIVDNLNASVLGEDRRYDTTIGVLARELRRVYSSTLLRKLRKLGVKDPKVHQEKIPRI